MNELKLNFNVQSHECAIDFFKCQKMRLGEKLRRSLGLTSSGRLWRFMADGAWFIGTGGPGRTDRWCTFRWRRPQREFHAQRRRNDRQQRHRQGKCRAMQIFLIMQNDGHFQKKCHFLFVWIFLNPKIQIGEWSDSDRFRTVPAKFQRLPAVPEYEKNRTYSVTTYLASYFKLKLWKRLTNELVTGGALHDAEEGGRWRRAARQRSIRRILQGHDGPDRPTFGN